MCRFVTGGYFTRGNTMSNLYNVYSSNQELLLECAEIEYVESCRELELIPADALIVEDTNSAMLSLLFS